ncbi:pantetheine-phosphate adenylyltransferase [Halarsenatibacter silvermanii]|uniref:Phosphopantetheine adenylyltransferase n=1 Tax=Halarsenatibacter silvermanii TaxID=321763 RepID=A0A1G9NRR4_9FIRM|nr:pantetheine-phosphate adenylyltransferase [Halarsenatibacter silvermanii]SDL89296.1 Phosphopantetheine adenylyltransferase [Halarsenatibacter silvermanii]
MNEKIVYPGTFDPLTLGHMNIIKRAGNIFSGLVVAVAENTEKSPLLSAEERTKIIKSELEDYPQVEVDSFAGLTVDYVKEGGFSAVLRGLRTVNDFENEMNMAAMNKVLDEEIETIFMMTDPEFSHISSSLVKEVARFDGDLEKFLPESSAEALDQKIEK